MVMNRVSAVGNGLSPRLRGNRISKHRHIILVGSIPAPAGEPACCRPSRRPATVYPRACGGTSRTSSPLVYVMGLSPRLRGNLSEGRIHARHYGSIPRLRGNPERG